MDDIKIIDTLALVDEFATAFETSKSLDLWKSLIDEEYAELGEAIALYLTDDTIESLANVLKEACDLVYVSSGFDLVLRDMEYAIHPDSPALMRQTFAVGAAIKVVGIEKFNEAFKRVHESNMSKLGDDGKPVRREDGKVLKGPNYKPPVLTDLVTEAWLSANAEVAA